MADTDPYQDSGLTSSLLNDAKSNSSDAASNPKPASSTKSASSGGIVKGIEDKGGKGGIIGAAKKAFAPKPAAAPATPTVGADSPSSGTVMGGNTAISTSSMKGSALANDSSSNLARKSEYRNVFHKRGAEGKHNWGGK